MVLKKMVFFLGFLFCIEGAFSCAMEAGSPQGVSRCFSMQSFSPSEGSFVGLRYSQESQNPLVDDCRVVWAVSGSFLANICFGVYFCRHADCSNCDCSSSCDWRSRLSRFVSRNLNFFDDSLSSSSRIPSSLSMDNSGDTEIEIKKK